MVFLSILFFIAVYIVLAILFVFAVNKFTKRKLLVWLAIVFVILLPIWDVVLGTAVYYIGCRYIPKTAIYETAETEGIYYEGDYKNYVSYSTGDIRVGLVDLDLEKGFKYTESLVTKKCINYCAKYENITSVLYRCMSLPRSPETPAYLPMQCVPVSNIQSENVVKVEKIKLGTSEIRSIKIKNRSTDKLMAEYNEVIIWPTFPFFSWMKWKWWSSKGISCPAISRFYDFQYDVLKLKK